MSNKRGISAAVEIIVGIVLIVCSMFGLVDEFWSGMGTSLLIIGIIFMIKALKYNINSDYREKYDIEISDERNKYISLKAWAWAGYLFVYAGGIGTILFKIVGKEDLMMTAATGVCIIMILYWFSYMVLKKKY